MTPDDDDLDCYEDDDPRAWRELYDPEDVIRDQRLEDEAEGR